MRPIVFSILEMTMKLPLIIKVFTFTGLIALSQVALCRVDHSQIEKAEEVLKKYQLDKTLSPIEGFKLYSTVAKELTSYGFNLKAKEYFLKAIEEDSKIDKKKVKDFDPLDTYTEYLMLLEKMSAREAKAFYEEVYVNILRSSSSSQKSALEKFWQNHFSKKPDTKNPFYGQYYKDKEIKKLIANENFSDAFKLIKAKDVSELSINLKLEYDLLSTLNKSDKKRPLFCEEKLNQYPNSAAISMEICRYIKNKKLKFGNLEEFEKRAQEESSSLNYLVKALKHLKE